MREIKFRAWNNTTKKYEGPYDMQTIAYALTSLPLSADDSLEQFTGLQDKHGNPIYEGDIVRVYDWGIKTRDNVLGVTPVVWDADDKGWRYQNEMDMDAYDQFRNVEVIGNVHENKDLL